MIYHLDSKQEVSSDEEIVENQIPLEEIYEATFRNYSRAALEKAFILEMKIVEIIPDYCKELLTNSALKISLMKKEMERRHMNIML